MDLFLNAISFCIMNFSFRSRRKQSKESLSSCRQLQCIENFVIQLVAHSSEYLFSVLSKTPYKIILFDNVSCSFVLFVHQFSKEYKKTTITG